jgi:hypothetical protein
MGSKYNELFSSLGYDALEVILGIHPRMIPETDVKKLIDLLVLSETNQSLEHEIQQIVNQFQHHPEMTVKLLLTLREREDDE